jgi:hypothetical protein
MSENPINGNHAFSDWPVIYSYTREQALSDGVLIDVTETAKEAGFKFPTAITSAVMSTVVRPPEIAVGESVEGRLWDVLLMLSTKVRSSAQNVFDDTAYFEVLATGDDGEHKTHQLWARCGPGDDGAPVITVTLQGED